MITSVGGTLERRLLIEPALAAPWRPFVWLWLGVRDVAACWPANVAHGLLMVLLGWVLLLMLGNHPYFVSAAVSGFLLLAPIMTTGLCELSRRRARGQGTSFNESLEVLNREGLSLFKFGAVLAAVAIAWFALSEILLAGAFSVPMPSVADTYYLGFLDEVNRAQVLWFIGTGGALAVAVFVLSVVTVPLIIDRQARAGEAMIASIGVVRANPLTMIVWSALILALTAIGFATLLLGMVVLIPLLGHATWHAYDDLVTRSSPGQP